MLKKAFIPGFVVGAAAFGAATAVATAPPVGPLPKGPATRIVAKVNNAFVVRLPKSERPGMVWRLARQYRSSVVRGVDEGETTKAVWLRFKPLSPGKTSLVFALTYGERSHAYASRTFNVTVR
jgi:hypothetical protein